jgi:hypothetical protein
MRIPALLFTPATFLLASGFVPHDLCPDASRGCSHPSGFIHRTAPEKYCALKTLVPAKAFDLSASGFETSIR